MKIDKKYIIIGICMIIGGVLALTLAFVGPNIITNGTINDTKVVTGNLKLNITDTSVNIDNMAPIRSSVYETEAFKKEFTISNAESTLNGCMKLYLNFNSISDSLKSEYLVYKIVSSTGNVSEGSFKDISDNKLLIYDSDYIESGKSISYTLYIWLRYVESPSIDLTSLLGTSLSAFVSVNGSDTKESTSCTFNSDNKISYVVTFMDEDDKTIKENRKVSSNSSLGSLPANGKYYTMKDGKGTEYTSSSIINDDMILYVMMEPSSFRSDSWKTIANAVKSGNISKYKLGDTKDIDVGKYGTRTLRIANTSTPSECSTEGFSQTACGFVLEFLESVSSSNSIVEVSSVIGWPVSNLYKFINNDVYNSLPDDLKNIIIDTYVVSSHGITSSNNFVSTDKLFLFSLKEFFGSTSDFGDGFSTSADDFTRQLDYYSSKNTNSENRTDVCVNRSGSTTVFRDIYVYSSNNEDIFPALATDMCIPITSMSEFRDFIPAFRIG